MKTGDKLQIDRIGKARYKLTLKRKAPNEGLVRLLLACPVKDWFEPFERGEMTDTCGRRRGR